MLNKKFLVTLAVVLVVGAGVIAGGLYLALDSIGQPTETDAPNPIATVPAPETATPANPAPRRNPLEGYQRIEPRPEGSPSGQNQQYYTPPSGPQSRSVEFHDARRKIASKGVEPDWTQFEGDELRELQHHWENYERKKARKEIRNNRRSLSPTGGNRQRGRPMPPVLPDHQ